MGGQVFFGVLGTVLADYDGVAVPLPAARQRAMLAALLLHPNRAVSFDALAEAVWADAPPPEARTTLRSYAMRLRRGLGVELGSRLVTRAPGYLLEIGEDELDLLRYTRLDEQGRDAAQHQEWERAARVLREALALWRGAPLADVESPVLHRDHGLRLAELRLQTLRRRVDADLALGRYHRLVAELRDLTAAFPLQERFHAQLMLALYGSGRQAEALTAYRTARDVLAAELGLEPDAELRVLQERILAGDAALTVAPERAAPSEHAASSAADAADAADAGPLPGPAAPAAAARPASADPTAPAQLPRDVPDFTGRDAPIAEVEGLLGALDAGGAVVISAVSGSGGIGKTAFAVHVAHRLRDRFPDGQLFARLQGTGDRPADPGDVLYGFLRALGVPGPAVHVDLEQRAAQYRSILARRRVLVVLDDVRDAAQVRPLLPGGGSCAALLTGRGRLTGLEGAGWLELGVLEPAEALTLFTRIVGPARVQAEPEAAAAVLAHCAGLPLAVRIAAARLAARPGWSVRALADRLADENSRLDELQAEDLAVRASLAVSYAGLPAADGPDRPDVARAFRLLGLWQGTTISQSAAAALFGRPDRHSAAALDHLVDAHFLEPAGTGRYRLHDLVRIYAAERTLAEETETDRAAALRRLLDWYLHTAIAAERRLDLTTMASKASAGLAGLADPAVRPLAFADRDAALDWYEAELCNLLAAIRHAEALGLDDTATRLPTAMYGFLRVRSRWPEWIASHELGLAAARRAGDLAAEAAMLNGLGVAHCHVRRFERGFDFFQETLAVLRRIGDLAGQGRTLLNLGAVSDDLGRPEQGVEYTLRASAVFHGLGDRLGEAICLGNVAWAYRGLGRLEEAAARGAEALRLVRAIGDRATESNVLSNLGVIHHDLGRPEAATAFFHQGLAIRRDMGNQYGVADTLTDLATLYAAAGLTDTARGHLQEAYTIFRDLDLPQARDVRARLEALG